MERKIAVCIIKNSKGELLLQKKTMDYQICPGGWCLFGGEIESEDLNKEIKRELQEELGIKLKPKFIFKKELSFNNINEIAYVFLAEINNISKISLKEGAGFALFEKKELKNLNINPDIKIILNEYFKK
jgi:8-oxo-dGTP pyrophosphatase MutT (NUDIX family)